MRVFIKQKGFTLVELVVSIAIGAFLIGSVSTLIVNSAKIAKQSRSVAVANSFAENKIEELRSFGYSGITSGPTVNISGELPSELSPPKVATLTISDQSASLKKAVLTVEYNDQGKQKTYSYTTLVGDKGVGQY